MKYLTRRICKARKARKERPVLKKIFATSLAIVIGGGAVVGITAAYYPLPFSPMNNTMETIDLGDETGPVAYKKSQLDGHSIAIGTRENCSYEYWSLPIEYKSVADALAEHKDAKPIWSYENKSNDWKCDRNENRKDAFNRAQARNGFDTGITGILNKDLANNRQA